MKNDGWRLIKLGQLLNASVREEKIDPVKEYSLLGVRLEGRGPFLREAKTGSQISAIKLFRVEERDFIYSRLFAWRGAFGIINKELDGCFVSGEFPIFTVNTQKLDPRFLFYWFRIRSTLDKVLSVCTGSTPLTRNRFKEEFFLQMEIPLPALPEQRRIVARIESLVAKIEEARQLRHQVDGEIDMLMPSAMQTLFDSLQDQYPKNRIGNLCEVVRGGSPRPAGSPMYYGGSIPFIKVGDITKDDSKYLLESSSTVNELGRSQSRYIEAGTLMLTNSGATLGVSKITKIAGCFNDGSQAFLNLNKNIEKEFLYYFFKSKTLWFRDWIARGQGQPNLNTEMTRQMEISVPPLTEQRRIVTHLDSMQEHATRLKRVQSETTTELDALLPSILDKAFKGEL